MTQEENTGWMKETRVQKSVNRLDVPYARNERPSAQRRLAELQAATASKAPPLSDSYRGSLYAGAVIWYLEAAR
jgi:hypothetical protein